MGKLITGWEANADGIRVWADIPKRRNGEHNEGALGKALLALGQVNPDAFDPAEEREPAPPVIPHSIAEAFQRDLTQRTYVVGMIDEEGNVIEELTIPGYRCANGQCLGD